MGVNELSEHTKRALDTCAAALAGLSVATVMTALNMIAVILSIVAALVSISWGLCRWRDRIKYGPPNSD